MIKNAFPARHDINRNLFSVAYYYYSGSVETRKSLLYKNTYYYYRT